MIPLVVAVVALVALVVIAIVATRSVSSQEELQSDQGPDRNELADRSNRMRAGLRRRRGGARRRGQEEDEEEEEEPRPEEEQQKPVSRRDAYEQRRAARDAEREAQEEAQRAEMLRVAQEREAKEQEEAEKWMHMFTMQEAGEEAISKDDGEELLNKMVEYIKTKKMVPLEDMAAQFGIRTADVIDKVKQLEGDKRITGIMDDRGKYIYISDEEMKSVAAFIKKRGRIGISELAKESAGLIDLQQKDDTVDVSIELDDL